MSQAGAIISRKYVGIISAVWVLLFILTVSESLFFYQINDRIPPYRNIIINDLYILCWIPISPFLFMLTRHWYSQRKQWLGFIVKMMAAAFITIAVLISLESCVHYLDRVNTEDERTWTHIYLQLISFRFHINLILYLGYSSISVAVLAYLEAKKSEEARAALSRNLIESQLGVLKAQMKPHFLFNSLHAISGLILKNKNELAITVIAKLSDLLRDSLNLDEKSWITLKEEQDYISRYLEIYVLRFGEQLNYSFELADGTESLLVPPALLQPIVENSLVHGIVPNDNQGQIRITVSANEEFITLKVWDSGHAEARTEVEKEEGVGLRNTRKRLSSLFADKYQFSLETTDDSGTTATIVFPTTTAI